MTELPQKKIPWLFLGVLKWADPLVSYMFLIMNKTDLLHLWKDESVFVWLTKCFWPEAKKIRLKTTAHSMFNRHFTSFMAQKHLPWLSGFPAKDQCLLSKQDSFGHRHSNYKADVTQYVSTHCLPEVLYLLFIYLLMRQFTLNNTQNEDEAHWAKTRDMTKYICGSSEELFWIALLVL